MSDDLPGPEDNEALPGNWRWAGGEVGPDQAYGLLNLENGDLRGWLEWDTGWSDVVLEVARKVEQDDEAVYKDPTTERFDSLEDADERLVDVLEGIA